MDSIFETREVIIPNLVDDTISNLNNKINNCTNCECKSKCIEIMNLVNTMNNKIKLIESEMKNNKKDRRKNIIKKQNSESEKVKNNVNYIRYKKKLH